MVEDCVVLGHVVSKRGIEVDKAKVEIIEKLLPPTCVKDLQSFLGHVGFHRRFIKDFSKLSKPLSNLLGKDVPFVFDKPCLDAFNELKKRLVSAPIVAPPIGAYLLRSCVMPRILLYVQSSVRRYIISVIYYASKTLDSAHVNYTTT